MESVTYVCYNQDDLIAQSKTFLTEIQNVKAALLKVAGNDTNAGTLEEIKALLGMTEPTGTTSETSSVASDEPKTEGTATDTKPEENSVTEPNTSESQPHTVTVQPGDTLQTIAEKTGTNPRHLIDMNMLMEPVVLHPGQSLKF